MGEGFSREHLEIEIVGGGRRGGWEERRRKEGVMMTSYWDGG